MRHTLKVGFSFGLTSGIITTLGLMVGLNAGSRSKLVVLGGILTIAIADAFSDALGIHVSEESENKHSHREIWESTISTFISKFLVAASFVLAIVLLPLETAVIINIIWGVGLLIAFNLYLGKNQNTATWKVVVEHLFIAFLVIVLTRYIGNWIHAACDLNSKILL
jgi:vacuolar iron transporter family protein